MHPSPSLRLRQDIVEHHVDHGSGGKTEGVRQERLGQRHGQSAQQAGRRLHHTAQLTVPGDGGAGGQGRAGPGREGQRRTGADQGRAGVGQGWAGQVRAERGREGRGAGQDTMGQRAGGMGVRSVPGLQ